MRLSSLIVMTLASSLAASGAYAATIVNKDKVPHTFTVTMGSKSSQVTLKAAETRKGLCDKPCELKLGDSKLKIDKKAETAWIQDGKLMMSK